MPHRVRAAALLVSVLLVASGCAGEIHAQTGPDGPRPEAPASVSVAPPTSAARPPTFDNTRADEACGLLTRSDIEQAFGAPAGEPHAVDPFCQWAVGTDAWLSLEVHRGKPVPEFRKDWGAAPVADAPVGGGYFANNKALVFGEGFDTYVLGWQKSGTWDDKYRTQQVAAANAVRGHVKSALTAYSAGPPPPSPDASRTPTPDRPLRLWVGGDSLAGGPSWAIGDQLDKTGLVRSHREFHVGTGLTRPDFLDWRAHLDAEVASYQPEVLVLLFGANDNQSIVVDGKIVTPDDPRWTEAYRQRIADVLDVTATDGRPVFWLGLPPMRDAKLNGQMARINQIAATEVPKHPGASYVDIWSMFSAPGRPGVYVDALPDSKGKMTSVRLDGIHLNTDGSLLLAKLLFPKLRERVPGLPSVG